MKWHTGTIVIDKYNEMHAVASHLQLNKEEIDFYIKSFVPQKCKSDLVE